MKMELSAIITAVSMLGTGTVTVKAEENKPTAAVSGYVSLENGQYTLADENKTPSIYIDNSENFAVTRAVQDLQTDIEKVTGIKPSFTEKKTSNNNNEFSSYGIYYDNGIMKLIPPEYDGTGTAIAAVYDQNGSVVNVSISKEINDKGEFVFDKAVYTSESVSIKGFVWDSIDNMKPLVNETIGLKQSAPDHELPKADVIIGTIGQSDAIDKLVSSGKIDVSDIAGKWECFKTQVVDDTLVIAGSDRRGTIYGIYDLSEKMGVSPWYYWADTPIGHADALYINLDEPYTEGEPSVKYRGIFMNDEMSFKNLALDKNDTDLSETYPHIFELILRLKGNYMWAAMQEATPAFHGNALNAENADKYGIVMGASHCEMLMRNNVKELKPFEEKWTVQNPDKPLYIKDFGGLSGKQAYVFTDKNPDTGDTVYNKEFLRDYWKESLETYGSYDNLYNIGMRGMHDEAWSPVGVTTTEEKAALQEEIITMQRALIQEVLGKSPETVPQMFIPYKEMQEIYDSGMNIPDDVTLMWTDDNYGYIRQLPTDVNRNRSGGAGIYYHISYHGDPNSYLWLCTTPLAQIREEMVKAYDNNAKQVWVANVGDIKPGERQIEYFLDLARNINTKDIDLAEYTSEKAKRDFGMTDVQANEYGEIAVKFDNLSFARKPEIFANNLFNLTNYGDESEKYLKAYADLTSRCETLYNAADENAKPAIFEMLLYPLRSCYNTAQKYIYADKSNAYFTAGRGASVNKYAKLSDSAYSAIADDTNTYNSMLDKKWNKIMDPFQNYWNPRFNSKNAIVSKTLSTSVSDNENSSMGISYESMDFSYYSTEARLIDIYNTGIGSFEYRVTADKEWVKLNKTNGIIYNDGRIWAGVDAQKAQSEMNNAVITIERIANENVIDTKTIPVSFNNNPVNIAEKTYAEADGYVSIEAEHYSDIHSFNDFKWQIEEGFARSGDSLKAYPNLAESIENPSVSTAAYAEYNVYFETPGSFDTDIYRIPTLNERGKVRMAIGVDDNAPVIVEGTNKYTGASGNDSWSKGVMSNNEILTTKLDITAGEHKIRIYTVDAGFILDKIVITTGKKVSSYFGAPESYNTTYNNIVQVLPQASETNPEDEHLKTIGIYSQDFGSDITGDNAITCSGGALYSEDNGAVKMNGAAGGNLTITNNTGFAQGQKIVVSADIAYGKISGKYMTYKICDSEGNEIINSHISAFNGEGSTQSVKICGEEQLTDGKYPSVISADNSAVKAGYTRYKTIIDPEKKTVRLTITNLKTKEFIEYSSTLTDEIQDISTLEFSTDYNISERSCYVDNIALSAMSKPQYGISVTAVDKTEAEITNADIVITDAVYNTVINAQPNGKYLLCEGVYHYLVTANGETKEDDFTVSASANNVVVKFDFEYTNELEVTVLTEDYTDTENSEILVWDCMESNVPTDNTASVSLSGGANYDADKGMIALSKANTAGGINISLASTLETDITSKAVIEFDMYFGKDSKKYSYYTIGGNNGEIVKFAFNEYNNSKDNTKLMIDGTAVASGGDILNVLLISKNSAIDNGVRHFKNVIDFETGDVSVYMTNGNTTVKFDGKTTSSAITDTAFSSDHTTSGRQTYVDNISIGTQAQNVKMVTLTPTVNGAVVDADITVMDINSGKETAYKNGGILLRDGSYRYSVEYNSNKAAGNFTVGDNENVLNNKTVYAFGDSIVYGHTEPDKSFIDIIANENNMSLNKYAVNGSTIIGTGSYSIISQITKAASIKPDVIVFDGYTNDASDADILTKLGEIQGNTANTFDTNTFCGAFENIVYTLKQKYPDTPIIYVTIHKSAARDWEVQTALRDKALEICGQWDIEVADVFADAELDTREDGQTEKYIIGGEGTHPNEAACREFYIPIVKQQLETVLK